MRAMKKPEVRRREMVEAASELFSRQGIERTTVSEIASAVDVTKGLVFYYFATKDDMVKAVIESCCQYIGNVAEDIAMGNGSAEEKVDSFLGHNLWQACFSQEMIADLCLPRNLALYADMCDRMCSHLLEPMTQVARQAMEERGIKPETPDHVEAALGVTIYGVLMMARTGRMTMKDVRSNILRLFDADSVKKA